MDLAVDSPMVISLSVTAVLAGIALLLGLVVLGKGQPKVERWVLSWLIFNAQIHFLLEGSFIALSLTGTVNSSDHFTALLWKEYGKADARWLVSDPTIVSLEILTVFIAGPLCLVVCHAILTKAYYRHYAQLTLCVCELYGGWMTFCPEWLTGSKYLDTSNFMFLWVYLVFFNALWVVMPLLLMYQSWIDMKAAFSAQAKSVTAGGKPEKRTYNPRGRKDK